MLPIWLCWGDFTDQFQQNINGFLPNWLLRAFNLESCIDSFVRSPAEMWYMFLEHMYIYEISFLLNWKFDSTNFTQTGCVNTDAYIFTCAYTASNTQAFCIREPCIFKLFERKMRKHHILKVLYESNFMIIFSNLK